MSGGAHGFGCICATCNPTWDRIAKCGEYGSGRGVTADSPFQKEIALAVAHSDHHSVQSRKHNEVQWSNNREGTQVRMPPEKVAEHITASTHHNRAADHFGSAARAFAENRPKAAKEHLEFAQQFAEKGKKASEKAFAV